MARVFISYSIEDQDFVESLKNSLQKLKIDDDSKPVETTWQKQTIDTEFRGQLRDADVVLALLSPKALAHSGVLFEIGAAQASGKKIVPIMLPDTNPDQIDFLDQGQAILDAGALSPSETAKRIEALIAEGDSGA